MDVSKDLEIYIDDTFITSVPIETESPAEVTIEYLEKLFLSLMEEYNNSELPRFNENQILLNNLIDNVATVITIIENREGQNGY